MTPEALALAAGIAMLPPAEYVYQPIWEPIVIETTLEEINRQCGTSMDADMIAVACTRIPQNNLEDCIIYWPEGLPMNEATKDLWLHEVAHCNGWPADHPGGYRP